MRLATTKVKELCARRGTRLGELLRAAGVSRTAYYSLARKDSILPKSIEAIARHLEVAPSEFLEEEKRAELQARAILARAAAIASKHRAANPENVRHTLLLLQKEPIERLRRALLRAQTIHIHRPRTGLPARVG
ncbi:MAG: hypothetical protein V1873_03425 [Verrucomicrobiota bacterium]